MGGRALNCPTTRLEADGYHELAERMADDVARAFGVRTHAVKAYCNKQDFGDLDLVVERVGSLAGLLDISWTPEMGNGAAPESEVITRLRAFSQHYHARAVYRERNSPVFTFEHRNSETDDLGFQIDLILAPSVDFDATCDYFAYNDLGNLVGRLAHEMGCKYGFGGLRMDITEGTQRLQSLCLSKDTRQIHDVLGLDHRRFLEGFDDMDAVFDFVMASKFFHPELYKLENAGYRERARDRKRVNYSAFLDRCEKLEPRAYTPMPSEEAIDWLARYFPDLPGRIAQVHDHEASRRELAGWFNGRTLGQWTGVSGPTLGALIGQLRMMAGDNNTLIAWGPEEVRQRAIEIAGLSAPSGKRVPGKPKTR